ncbi:hypothetical protein ACQPXH_00995 [Nocardia sp. CA-135953]|uniref:hypothetical protein n=1 Tax=Nocardia sp. CA-135953 TaxID=3239978 RepID=UPI003D95D2E8
MAFANGEVADRWRCGYGGYRAAEKFAVGALWRVFGDPLWKNIFQKRQNLFRWQHGEFVRQFGGDAGDLGEADDTIGELRGGNAE